VDSEDCGCEGGWVTLDLRGCELPAVEFFECNFFAFSFCFCFCFANATSLAEAFLYVTSGRAERRRSKNNIHVCPSHMGPRQLWGCALPTQFLHHFVCAV
jgi:hypothetical protein